MGTLVHHPPSIIPISIRKEGSYKLSGLPNGDYELSTIGLMFEGEDGEEDGFHMAPERFLPVVIQIREQSIISFHLHLQLRLL